MFRKEVEKQEGAASHLAHAIATQPREEFMRPDSRGEFGEGGRVARRGNKASRRAAARRKSTAVAWMAAAPGLGVSLLGIFLAVGNVSGKFVTFPYAGYLTMSLGAAILTSCQAQWPLVKPLPRWITVLALVVSVVVLAWLMAEIWSTIDFAEESLKKARNVR